VIVHFVHIEGIVDHHCLNFLSITFTIYSGAIVDVIVW